MIQNAAIFQLLLVFLLCGIASFSAQGSAGFQPASMDSASRAFPPNANSACFHHSAPSSYSDQNHITDASPAVLAVETIRGSDYGGGIGGVLYTVRGGVPSYNAYNSRGDVVARTNDTGTATWQAAYEAFGTRTAEDGTIAERQAAKTKDEDPTGLLNEGFRYRDLEAGIFITRDPLGFVDGPNVYNAKTPRPFAMKAELADWTRGASGVVPVFVGRAVEAGKDGDIFCTGELSIPLDKVSEGIG